MNLAEIREKYPEYESLPDQELAERLYQKHYADVMTFEEFASRITVPSEAGGSPDETAPQRTVAERMRRPFGLTARYLAEGLGETADIFTNPIRAGLQQVPGLGDRFQESTSEGIRRIMDKYGVPAPESPAEEVVGTASRLVAGTGPFVGVGQHLAAGAPSGVQKAGEILATGPGMQAATAGAAGAGGEAVRQEGGGPGAQLVGSLVVGLAPAAAKTITTRAFEIFTPMTSRVDEILSQYDMRGVPLGVVQNLRERVNQALRTGGELDQAALKRMVAYSKAGVTPTRGKISRDFAEWAEEEQLARIGSQSTDKNIQELARLKNENYAKLIQGLDEIAEGTNLDLFRAGEASIEEISKRNNQFRAIQSALYAKARDKAGRSLPLKREEFIDRADTLLRKDNKTRFLPKEIRKMIDDIASGKVKGRGGEEFDVPFTVDQIDELETVLATAQRNSKDGNTKRAISLVKQALMETDIEAPRDVDLAEDALKAFRRARRYSRKLYEWQEKSPAIKAIIDGEATPDQFVKEFVLGETKKASVGNLETTMKEIKDPEVKALIRVQVAAWIRNQATSGKSVEMTSFSQSRLNRALDKIGDRKLDIIFGAKDRKELRNIGYVGELEQVPPAASYVNYSGSATSIIAAFSNWLSRKTSMLPGSDLLIRQPAQAIEQFAAGRQVFNPELAAPAREAIRPPLAIPLGAAASRSASGNSLERDREGN